MEFCISCFFQNHIYIPHSLVKLMICQNDNHEDYGRFHILYNCLVFYLELHSLVLFHSNR